MNLKAVVAAAALGVAGMGTAQAVTVFNWSYSGPGITASGTLTTSGTAAVLEDVIAVSGTRNGVAITGLVPLDTDDNFIYDNKFTIGLPHFTEGGLLFDLAGNAPNVNIYFFGGQYEDGFVDGLDFIATPVTFTVTAVPEPATVASMLAGLGLLGVAMRKKRKDRVAA